MRIVIASAFLTQLFFLSQGCYVHAQPETPHEIREEHRAERHEERREERHEEHHPEDHD